MPEVVAVEPTFLISKAMVEIPPAVTSRILSAREIRNIGSGEDGKVGGEGAVYSSHSRIVTLGES